MDNKTYLDLTADEVKSRSALTLEERSAVDALIKAIKALPKSLCIDLDDPFDSEPGNPSFRVLKRITRGSAHPVAEVRKKSLRF